MLNVSNNCLHIVATAVLSSKDRKDDKEQLSVGLCRYCKCCHDRVITPQVSMQFLSTTVNEDKQHLRHTLTVKTDLWILALRPLTARSWSTWKLEHWTQQCCTARCHHHNNGTRAEHICLSLFPLFLQELSFCLFFSWEAQTFPTKALQAFHTQDWNMVMSIRGSRDSSLRLVVCFRMDTIRCGTRVFCFSLQNSCGLC